MDAMARGWESKSVESQIEAAEARQTARTKTLADAASSERQRARESLELARKRVLHDLESTHNFRLEKMLRASLKHLDDKIAELQPLRPND
jgi:molecular chaperone GrpE (heat shock protein)